MTVLSDRNITARLIAPFTPSLLQPSSMDVRLGGSMKRLPYGVILDPEQDQSHLFVETPIRDSGPYEGRWWLGQGTLHLGVTLERITVPDNMVAHVHGLSSLGRLGLLVHCTAGLIDAGWEGPITLEIISLAAHIVLRPGMRIAQVAWMRLDTPCKTPYCGRYVGSGVAPTPSRSHLDGEVKA